MIRSSSPKKSQDPRMNKVLPVPFENCDLNDRVVLTEPAYAEGPPKKLLKLRKIDITSEECDKARLFARYDKERKLRDIN